MGLCQSSPCWCAWQMAAAQSRELVYDPQQGVLRSRRQQNLCHLLEGEPRVMSSSVGTGIETVAGLLREQLLSGMVVTEPSARGRAASLRPAGKR